MTRLLLILILLFPIGAFAQTMWPVPQRDGSIVYVPIGTGNPPLWPSSDGRGGMTYIPNGVGSPPVQPATPRYTPPPLTLPDPPRRSYLEYDQAVHDRMADFLSGK